MVDLVFSICILVFAIFLFIKIVIFRRGTEIEISEEEKLFLSVLIKASKEYICASRGEVIQKRTQLLRLVRENRGSIENLDSKFSEER